MREIGKAAAEQGRTAGKSSFGPRTRDVTRQQSRRFLEGPGSSGAAPEPNALVACEVGPRCEVAITEALQHVDSNRVSLPEVLAVARSSLRKQTAIAQFAEKRDETALQQWLVQQQPQVLDEVAKLCPRLSPLRGALECLPSLGGFRVQVKHPLETSARIASWISSTASQSNLPKALDQQWLAMHKPIMHADCPEVPTAAELPKRKPTRPPCHQVGFCLCGPAGRNRELLRHGFYTALKAVTKTGSPGRTALVDRMLVVKVERGPVDDGAEESPWEAIAASIGGSDVAPTTFEYWHVSTVSFNPYGMTFRPLRFLREELRGATSEHHLEVTVWQFPIDRHSNYGQGKGRCFSIGYGCGHSTWQSKQHGVCILCTCLGNDRVHTGRP